MNSKTIKDGTIICRDCGNEVLRRSKNQKRCDGCAKAEQRRVKRESFRLHYTSRRAAKHGMEEEQLLAMYASQSERCAVCWEKADLEDLAIDHDHSCCTGARSCGKCVRGLIHQNHNSALGAVNDDIDELYRLIAYLSMK